MCAYVHMCAYVCMCACVHMCACVCAFCIYALAYMYTKRKTRMLNAHMFAKKKAMCQKKMLAPQAWLSTLDKLKWQTQVLKLMFQIFRVEHQVTFDSVAKTLKHIFRGVVTGFVRTYLVDLKRISKTFYVCVHRGYIFRFDFC